MDNFILNRLRVKLKHGYSSYILLNKAPAVSKMCLCNIPIKNLKINLIDILLSCSISGIVLFLFFTWV